MFVYTTIVEGKSKNCKTSVIQICGTQQEQVSSLLSGVSIKLKYLSKLQEMYTFIQPQSKDAQSIKGRYENVIESRKLIF